MQVLEIGGHQVIDGLLHALVRVPPQSIRCAASTLSSYSELLTAMTRLVLTVSLLRLDGKAIWLDDPFMLLQTGPLMLRLTAKQVWSHEATCVPSFHFENDGS